MLKLLTKCGNITLLFGDAIIERGNKVFLKRQPLLQIDDSRIMGHRLYSQLFRFNAASAASLAALKFGVDFQLNFITDCGRKTVETEIRA